MRDDVYYVKYKMNPAGDKAPKPVATGAATPARLVP